MKKLIVSSLLVAISACGAVEEEPVQIVFVDSDTTTTPNNAPKDDDAENNVSTPNNVTPTRSGLALLGDGNHTVAAVNYEVVGSSAAGLRIPRDLAFHPNRANELWVLNLGDNSTVVFDGVGTSGQSNMRYAGAGKDHFMARPSALAFGSNGNFASAHEEDEPTQGPASPADFMGPTLWSSDRAIYDGGHGGHLDMLHNSPNGAGIAWESGNRYWIFDGYHGSITMYDFHSDHGPGGQDHADGEVARYVEGEVGYVDDVPSHLEYDQTDKILYIADTGNNRIATLDPSVGEMGGRVGPNYDGGAQYTMNGGLIETWVDGADVMLEVPSGLEIHDGMVFVSDNKLSRIVAIDKATGEVVDYLDLDTQVPTGGLMGMAFSADGSLYAVNAVGNEIVRITAKDGGVPE